MRAYFTCIALLSIGVQGLVHGVRPRPWQVLRHNKHSTKLIGGIRVPRAVSRTPCQSQLLLYATKSPWLSSTKEAAAPLAPAAIAIASVSTSSPPDKASSAGSGYPPIDKKEEEEKEKKAPAATCSTTSTTSTATATVTSTSSTVVTTAASGGDSSAAAAAGAGGVISSGGVDVGVVGERESMIDQLKSKIIEYTNKVKAVRFNQLHFGSSNFSIFNLSDESFGRFVHLYNGLAQIDLEKILQNLKVSLQYSEEEFELLRQAEENAKRYSTLGNFLTYFCRDHNPPKQGVGDDDKNGIDTGRTTLSAAEEEEERAMKFIRNGHRRTIDITYSQVTYMPFERRSREDAMRSLLKHAADVFTATVPASTTSNENSANSFPIPPPPPPPIAFVHASPGVGVTRFFQEFATMSATERSTLLHEAVASNPHPYPNPNPYPNPYPNPNYNLIDSDPNRLPEQVNILPIHISFNDFSDSVHDLQLLRLGHVPKTLEFFCLMRVIFTWLLPERSHSNKHGHADESYQYFIERLVYSELEGPNADKVLSLFTAKNVFNEIRTRSGGMQPYLLVDVIYRYESQHIKFLTRCPGCLSNNPMPSLEGSILELMKLQEKVHPSDRVPIAFATRDHRVAPLLYSAVAAAATGHALTAIPLEPLSFDVTKRMLSQTLHGSDVDGKTATITGEEGGGRSDLQVLCGERGGAGEVGNSCRDLDDVLTALTLLAGGHARSVQIMVKAARDCSRRSRKGDFDFFLHNAKLGFASRHGFSGGWARGAEEAMLLTLYNRPVSFTQEFRVHTWLGTMDSWDKEVTVSVNSLISNGTLIGTTYNANRPEVRGGGPPPAGNDDSTVSAPLLALFTWSMVADDEISAAQKGGYYDWRRFEEPPTFYRSASAQIQSSLTAALNNNKKKEQDSSKNGDDDLKKVKTKDAGASDYDYNDDDNYDEDNDETALASAEEGASSSSSSSSASVALAKLMRIVYKEISIRRSSLPLLNHSNGHDYDHNWSHASIADMYQLHLLGDDGKVLLSDAVRNAQFNLTQLLTVKVVNTDLPCGTDTSSTSPTATATAAGSLPSLSVSDIDAMTDEQFNELTSTIYVPDSTSSIDYGKSPPEFDYLLVLNDITASSTATATTPATATATTATTAADAATKSGSTATGTKKGSGKRRVVVVAVDNKSRDDGRNHRGTGDDGNKPHDDRDTDDVDVKMRKTRKLLSLQKRVEKRNKGRVTLLFVQADWRKESEIGFGDSVPAAAAVDGAGGVIVPIKKHVRENCIVLSKQELTKVYGKTIVDFANFMEIFRR